MLLAGKSHAISAPQEIEHHARCEYSPFIKTLDFLGTPLLARPKQPLGLAC